MLITLSVLNPLKSRFVKPKQSLNIPDMLVTWAVLKPLTSRLVKPLQPLNIFSMLVTDDVFRYSFMPVMDVRFVIIWNQQ